MTFTSLAEFCRLHELKPADIVEVGVYLGANALRLRQEFPGAMLRLVDPWMPHRLARTYEIDNSPAKWEAVYARARALFAKDKRVRFYRETSGRAVRRFRAGTLGLIFLDAGRSRDRVVELIREWRPKLAPGGVMAGKGLAGNLRRDVRAALDAELPGWQSTGGTTWVWHNAR